MKDFNWKSIGAILLLIVATATASWNLTNVNGGISQAAHMQQVNSDWNATSGTSQVLNKPTVPLAQVNSDWNATSGVQKILNEPSSMPSTWGQIGGTLSSQTDLVSSLALKLDIAGFTSAAIIAKLGYTPYNGSTNPFSFLTSVPAQTWSSITGKPTFATVATTGAYADLSGLPTIPTVPQTYVNGTLQANVKTMLFSGTISSGAAVFYTTIGGTSGGTAICTGTPVVNSVGFNNAANMYGYSYAFSNSNKTLTITVNQSSATGVISLLGLNLLSAPTTAANGAPITASVSCN